MLDTPAVIDIPISIVSALMNTLSNALTSVWVVDSGCTQFMCNRLCLFMSVESVNVMVRLGDQNTVRVYQAGDVLLFGCKFCALYIPSFRLSLISVADLDHMGFSTVFANERVTIIKGDATCGVAKLNAVSGLYELCDNGVLRGGDLVRSVVSGEDNEMWDVNCLATTRATTRGEGRVVQKRGVLLAGWLLLRRNRRSQQQRLITEDSLDSEGEYSAAESSAKSALISVVAETDKNLKPLGTKRRRFNAQLELWHARLGHIYDVPLRLLLRDSPNNPTEEKGETLTPSAPSNDFNCAICDLSKAQQRTGKDITIPRSLILYERVHSDVCGPMPVPTLGGSCYYVVFVEDSTRYGEVYVIKKRSEVLNCWLEYRRRRITMGYLIMEFRSDNGGEFKGLAKDLTENGIVWERSPPYTQHANGVAERFIRSMNTKARALMLGIQMPQWSWGDAILTACYLHRLIPQRNLNWKSPYELMFGLGTEGSGERIGSTASNDINEIDNVDYRTRLLNIKHLRVFGCLCYRWLHAAQRKSGKWVARANPCMFVGYCTSKTVYKIYDFVTLNFYECSSMSFREDQSAWPLFGNAGADEVANIFNGYYELNSVESTEVDNGQNAIHSALSRTSSSHTPLRGKELFAYLRMQVPSRLIPQFVGKSNCHPYVRLKPHFVGKSSANFPVC